MLKQQTRVHLQSLLEIPIVKAVVIEDCKYSHIEGISSIVRIHTSEGTLLSDISDYVNDIFFGSKWEETATINGTNGTFCATELLNDECELRAFTFPQTEKAPLPESPEKIELLNGNTETWTLEQIMEREG